MQAGAPPGWHGAEVAKLDSELQTWLILCAVGWFAGLMFFVGPAAWWKSGDLRDKYQRIGAPVPGNVNALRLLGIVTCVLCAVLFVVVGAGLAFVFVFAASHGVR
jgi:hypothetical protein